MGGRNSSNKTYLGGNRKSLAILPALGPRRGCEPKYAAPKDLVVQDGASGGGAL